MKTLDDVKVGDLLILVSGISRVKTIISVDGVTKTLIKSENMRFRKSDGRMNGSTSVWCSSYVYIPKDGEIESLCRLNKKHKVLRKLHELTACDITYEQALEFDKILKTIGK